MKVENPKQLAATLEILPYHSQYAESFAKKLEAVEADQRHRYLFMLASRWPDDVRDEKHYHRGPLALHHYPMVSPAEASEVKPPGPAAVNLLTALAENTKTMRDDGAPASGPAIAVCWVMHVYKRRHVRVLQQGVPQGRPRPPCVKQ